MNNEEIISRILEDVDFESYSQVKEAADKLEDIDPQEVIDWISDQLKGSWDYTEVINYGGVQNIEKAFGREFDLAVLIDAFFSQSEHWHYPGNASYWVDYFNELTGKAIMLEDVVGRFPPAA